METPNRTQHWQTVYQTKSPNEVSWTQQTPTALAWIEQAALPKSARIIDIGGGDSLLVDHLLDRGYTDLTVLDISAAALDRAKTRLGDRADAVQWIVADAARFQPTGQYDFWHDRAAFHFLTSDEDIAGYLAALRAGVKAGGTLVMGTFSETGPLKCSGIEVHRYSDESLTARFAKDFEKMECLTEDHTTPFGTTQNFLFCRFRRKA